MIDRLVKFTEKFAEWALILILFAVFDVFGLRSATYFASTLSKENFALVSIAVFSPVLLAAGAYVTAKSYSRQTAELAAKRQLTTIRDRRDCHFGKTAPTQISISLSGSAPTNHHSQALRVEGKFALASIRNALPSASPLLRSQQALRYPLQVMDKFDFPQRPRCVRMLANHGEP